MRFIYHAWQLYLDIILKCAIFQWTQIIDYCHSTKKGYKMERKNDSTRCCFHYLCTDVFALDRTLSECWYSAIFVQIGCIGAQLIRGGSGKGKINPEREQVLLNVGFSSRDQIVQNNFRFRSFSTESTMLVSSIPMPKTVFMLSKINSNSHFSDRSKCIVDNWMIY